MAVPYKVITQTVTIAAGTSLSAATSNLGGYSLIGISMDAAWDTNAVTFQGSFDGTTYYNVYEAGTELSFAGVVASSFNSVEQVYPFLPWRYLKVRSGTAAATVNQAGATVVTLYLMPI